MDVQTDESLACLLELSEWGKKPLTLNEVDSKQTAQRTFLEDGDEVILTGWAEGHFPENNQMYRVGFGNCTGIVLPAHPAHNE